MDGWIVNTCRGQTLPSPPSPAPLERRVLGRASPAAPLGSGLGRRVSLQQITIVVEKFQSSKSKGSCGDHSVYCYDCFNLVLVSPHSPLPEACPSAHSSHPHSAKVPFDLNTQTPLLTLLSLPATCHYSATHSLPPTRRGARGTLCLGNAAPPPSSVLLPCWRGCERVWAGRGRAGHRLVVWG